MGFGYVAMQMVVVSLPILLGWVAHRIGLMDPAFDRGLSQLVLNVGLPCMILSSLNGVETLPAPADMLLCMVAVAVIYVIAIACAFVACAILKPPAGTEGIYRFSVAFGNCGFIGFPVISAVFGQKALLTASIGLIPANIFLFTVGAAMFSGTEGGMRAQAANFLSCLKTPTLLASFAVLALALAGVSDLGFVGSSLDIAGQLTTPSALLLTGSSIAQHSPLSMLSNWRAYACAACRLLAAPVLGMLAVRAFLPAETLGILVLQAAMPVATNGTLYCLQRGLDSKPLMQTTFVSIAASVATIPLVATLVGA